MAATFTVYETDGTSRGTVGVSDGSWEHRQAEDGAGRITVKGDVASNRLGEMTVVRVNDGTDDRFAFVPLSKTRRQAESSTVVDLHGPGVRWLLHAGQVLQEDTSDCALPADVRWFGWMSGDYDDSSWTAPASHGSWRSQPFETARPEGFPDPFAEFIWRTTSYDLGEEEVLFRQEFNVTDEDDYVLCIAADDEYEAWLDGTKLPIGTYGGDRLYQWREYDEFPVKLCTGDHVLAVKGRNLPANVAGANPAWVIWTITNAAGDGHPAAQNAIWNVTTDATGGTFTIRTSSNATTATIDYNDSAADFQTALEAVIGAGNVDVSGSAGDWDIEFIGAFANVSEGIVVDGTNLTGGTGITATETQRGASSPGIARSDTNVVHYYPSSTEPGMTPGHILKVAMDEARARGTTVLDDVTDGYSATLDSNSEAWTFELNLPVPLPADVHRVAVLLEEQGIDVWMDPDLTLQASGEQGQDDTASTTFTAGSGGVTNVTAVQEESTIRNIVRLRTTTGWVDVSDSSSVSARGRWESGLVLEGFDTEEQASGHTNLLLGDLATPQRHSTFELPSEAATVPYADFGIGDRVNAPVFGTSGFATDAVRVVGISGRVAEASIVWTVEVVD